MSGWWNDFKTGDRDKREKTAKKYKKLRWKLFACEAMSKLNDKKYHSATDAAISLINTKESGTYSGLKRPRESGEDVENAVASSVAQASTLAADVETGNLSGAVNEGEHMATEALHMFGSHTHFSL